MNDIKQQFKFTYTLKNIHLLLASVFMVLECLSRISTSFSFSCSPNQIVGSQIFCGGFFKLSLMMTFVPSIFSDEIFSV